MDSATIMQIFGRPLGGFANPLTGQLPQQNSGMPEGGSSSSPFFMPNESQPSSLPANGNFGATQFTAPSVGAASAPAQPGLQRQLNKSAASLSSQMPGAVASARNNTQIAQTSQGF